MKLKNFKEKTKNLIKPDQVVSESKKEDKNNGITSTSLEILEIKKKKNKKTAFYVHSTSPFISSPL
jgi:hypothetical protein